MPAKSKKQKRLMGMVYAYKKGKLSAKNYSESLITKIRKMAKRLSFKQLKDFMKN